jgi:Tol biopolymer transport system component
VLRLGDLLLLERSGAVPPYDGETWSWSPPELNRIAYVDQRGDLWVASADGRKPQRLIRGEFTLPAWSDDGRVIAVAERKNGGKRWEISVVQVPQELRKP